jgi:hypothetical protein
MHCIGFCTLTPIAKSIIAKQRKQKKKELQIIENNVTFSYVNMIHPPTKKKKWRRRRRSFFGIVFIPFIFGNVIIFSFIFFGHTNNQLKDTIFTRTVDRGEEDTILPPRIDISLSSPQQLLNTTMSPSSSSTSLERGILVANRSSINKNSTTTYHTQNIQTKPLPKDIEEPQQQQRTSPSQSNTYLPMEDRLETLEYLKEVLGIDSNATIISVLNSIGYQRSDISTKIPPWSEINRRYGPIFPKIIGLERCEDYRKNIQKNLAWVAPAGLFHSGTNLLHNMLAGTCRGLIPQGQVPYGKHNPIRAATEDNYRIPTKDAYKAVKNLDRVLPIVMVRNPLDWMESMCQQRFSVSWNQSAGNNNSTNTPQQLPCPSLDTPIHAKLYRNFNYSNVLKFWEDWNSEYYNYTRPRLMVRLEDLVYSPVKTLKEICNCAGGDFTFDHQIIQDRKGGSTRSQRKQKENFLVQAWSRHSRVGIRSTLSSSIGNQRLFRKYSSDGTQLKELLQNFHYNQID